MNKYHVLPLTVYGPEGRSKPRISWRVVDTEQSDDGRWKVATCPDEDIARKVCAFLNGEGGHWLDPDLAQRHADALALAALRDANDRWQSTLDHANKQTAEARAERDEAIAGRANWMNEATRASRELADMRGSFVAAMDKVGALTGEVETLRAGKPVDAKFLAAMFLVNSKDESLPDSVRAMLRRLAEAFDSV